MFLSRMKLGFIEMLPKCRLFHVLDFKIALRNWIDISVELNFAIFLLSRISIGKNEGETDTDTYEYLYIRYDPHMRMSQLGAAAR